MSENNKIDALATRILNGLEASSPEPFPALDDKKLSRAIDLDIEALNGCETLDERLTIARHLVALCEESARRASSVSPAASAPPAVPNIEDGGCDICDDPNCYRNQP